MDVLKAYLPFLIPVVLIEIALMVFALAHVLRHPRYKFGNRLMWVFIVVFFQIIGPIAYFVFGREEE